MALSSGVLPKLIAESSLEGWEVIGSGGFGQIFKARHCQLCCDVAIKLLYHDDGSSKSLLREVDMMHQGSSPYVIHVLGVFKGRAPGSSSVQLGLVMEVMERGSLASLQESLRGTPPWPLVFRLGHQVALGINFLHNLTPPMLHLDLKPSNVLLDSCLNAKLTDFGLARFYQSLSRVSNKDSVDGGGTISYMPPEAFALSYSPTRASDIYSYGILLWSIVRGKQPYPSRTEPLCNPSNVDALPSMVRLRIPQGDRPMLDEIRIQAAGIAGLIRLMELMEKCWESIPEQRPSSHDCTTVTEDLYKMHKHAIIDAVHQVLKKLDQIEGEGMVEQMQRVNITQDSASNGVRRVDVHDMVPTRGPPIQEMAGGCTAHLRDKPRVRDSRSPRPASMSEVEMGHVKVSSVYPIPSVPTSHSTERSSQGKAVKTSQLNQFYQGQQLHHKFSIPDASSSNNHLANVTIHMSDITGVQIGNNNSMHINTREPSERKRHPTAPPRVNLPPPCSGSCRDKTGRVG